jgi:type I restriction enzyme M protein
MFLKVIDEFNYDHSERLGDAFEYLLSVLGSQGDAGQFRTPRHIIDFIVSIVDPKKNESILDPACGTAGFLISSYKHILRANTDAKGNVTLTPDERGRLAANLKGYDISPDIIRLSLVNLYLHGFSNPQIDEYDTLTSEDKWNEFADVILANPPFMSPKGGIKPHKRFSIQAKRSEVLFVDYMAEHLTPTGRAGIIVPEGIIFQSQGAYKDLRKMLVENALVAVVSLPAGCFNPYSGVKTSILILDKSLARQSDTIAFFKVENDGFGLGAQRRAFDKNDLPQVKAELDGYLHALRRRQPTDDLQPTCGLIVPKERIAANGDYNLSGERYREGSATVSAWPFVLVGDVFRKADETVVPETLGGPVIYLGLENITQNTGEIEGYIVTEKPLDIKSVKNVFKPRDILYGKLRPNLNKVWLADRKGICSTDIFVIEALEGRADPALYAFLFRTGRFNDAVMGQLKGAQLPRIGWSSFAELQIPLPPLELQKEIVAEIVGYQKVISGARAVLDHYRPYIPIHPDWPLVELGEVIKLSSGRGLTQANMEEGSYPVYGGNGTTGTHSEYLLETANVVIGRVGAYCGAVHITEPKAWVTDNALYITEFKQEIDLGYLAQVLAQLNLNQYAKVGGQPSISQTTVYERTIPLPPIATQKAIVAGIEAEQALVAANRELIARFEKKIQATLARVWGEEAPAAEAPVASEVKK